MNPPKVVVSSAGVFHAYHLARAAQSARYLHRFITSIYSRHERGIDRERVVQIRLPGLLAAALERIPSEATRPLSYYVTDNLYDRLASRHVRDADIFHVFNHHGLHSIRMAKEHGALCIVERSSAHPRFQFELLADEYRRFGLEYPSVYRLLLDKHLAEYEAADYVMVASDFVRRTMVKAGVPEHKLRQVHLGFDPARFHPGYKPDNVFRIMYAGILSLQKGIPYLLEAFRQLDLPNSELLLVGQPYPDARAILADYEGIFRHVRFMPQAKLVEQYHRASAFVLPSIQDGFGMVAYEAAASGLPVIITENVGADIRDGTDGFVVPIRDVEALAEKIVYLYEHPDDREIMGRAACEYVQKFTWQNYHREVIAHYDSMLAARRN